MWLISRLPGIFRNNRLEFYQYSFRSTFVIEVLETTVYIGYSQFIVLPAGVKFYFPDQPVRIP